MLEKLANDIAWAAMEKLASKLSRDALISQITKLKESSPKKWPTDLGFRYQSVREVPYVNNLDINVTTDVPSGPSKLYRAHSNPDPFVSTYGDRAHFTPSYNLAQNYRGVGNGKSDLGIDFISAGIPANPKGITLFPDFGIERGRAGMSWESIQKEYAAASAELKELLQQRQGALPGATTGIDDKLKGVLNRMSVLSAQTHETPVAKNDLSKLTTFTNAWGSSRPYTPSQELMNRGYTESPLIQVSDSPEWEELLLDIAEYSNKK